MGYERLEKSLIDLVKEEQAKLGYRKEMIRLYYPLSSLNHFMETNADSEEMQELLTDFPKAAEDIFGEVGITHAKDRFCICFTEKASEYVHENMKPNDLSKSWWNLSQSMAARWKISKYCSVLIQTRSWQNLWTMENLTG